MIILKADERQACARVVGRVTTGSVGIPVELELSDDFDGLAVTVCFECGGDAADVVWHDGAEVTVPAQLLAHEGERLKVGVYGARADGEVVIPTVWATADVVRLGAVPSGVDPSQPEPDWTAQVQSIAAEAIETANSVRDDADAGEFDGFSPSASVTKSGDTATITITDKDGTTTADVNDGIQGADGISPSVSITDSASSHTVTITDSTGDHSYTVPTYADEEQAREDAWDALESTVTDARDEALSAAALARNVNGNKLAKTLSGTVLTADDAYAAPPIDAVIYGASTQDGTSSTLALVPIESVDALTLCVAGRNLLDVINGSATGNGITFTENTDGSVTVSGSTQSSSASLVINSSVRLLDGVTYTLSGCPENGGSSKWRLYYSGVAAHYDNGRGVTWRQSGDDVGPVYIRIYANQTVNFTFYPQLEIGPTATPYQPYVGTSTSIDLQGHKLRSLPDGTRDELTLTPDGTEYRVTLMQRVGFIADLSANGVNAFNNDSSTPYFTFALTGMRGINSDVVNTMSDAYQGRIRTAYQSPCCYVTGNGGSLLIGDSRFAGMERADALALLSGVSAQYRLLTPRTIDLGTMTLQTLPAPDVTVWASGGSAQPSLTVTYERDANMAESAINADVDELHDDVTELRTDTDGLLANVAQIPSMLSQQLTAGAAGGITGGGPTDSAAWTERVTGGGDASDGPATIESIHGRTVVWNQHAPAVDDESWNAASSTIVADATVHSITVMSTTNNNAVKRAGARYSAASGHKYLLAASVDTSGITDSGNASFGFNNASSNAGTITIAAGSKERISGIVTASESTTIVARIPSTTASGESATFADMLCFDLTLMFGAGNEPSTVAEFERMFPEAYYPYDAGSLLSVHMTGIETNGRNLWGGKAVRDNIMSAIPQAIYGVNKHGSYVSYYAPNAENKVFFDGPFKENTQYTLALSIGKSNNVLSTNMCIIYTDGSAEKVQRASRLDDGTPETLVVYTAEGKTVESINGYYQSGITYLYYDNCGLFEGVVTAADYQPYWQQTRTIDTERWFPDGMRSAGSVYDELTADAAVTRVGSVDLGTLRWQRSSISSELGYRYLAALSDASLPADNNTKSATIVCPKYDVVTANQTGIGYEGMALAASGNFLVYDSTKSSLTESEFKTAMSGVYLYYALATPTTTPIDPPLNLTYRAAQGGTERVTHTDPTAPPTLDVTYGSTADGIRDRALSAIAPVENGRASANYAVGSYLIHDGTLCKVTTAIASGEAVAIGTNVTATTVMAEVIALTQ